MKRAALATWLAAWLVAAAGCARSDAARPEPRPSAPPVAAPARTDAGPPGAGNKCAELRASYEQRKAAGGRCQRDADCGCYYDLAVVGTRHVSDVATAKELQRLSTAYSKAACPTIDTTGPPLPPCATACRGGTCAAR